jgi:hydrogenase nickel incorporation protein HypB
MCAICGCSDAVHGHGASEHVHEHEHEHDHAHDHEHEHAVDSAFAHAHELQAAILGKNDRIAAITRRFLAEHRILALNLVSSPGAGKTTVLERTIAGLRGEREIQVIEGDQATSHDAARIRDAGALAIQINTGTGCHLDAAMVEGALRELAPSRGTLLFIENVGNLVCPALFDLGERAKVVIASVTEGEDKPLKYPHMFRASQLVLLNKMDLLPHVRFDVQRFVRNARQVNSALEVLPISAVGAGAGLERWYSWLRGLDVRT